ncbi:MAG: hypothetical protein WCF69_03510 [Mycobacterium sp.]
MIYTLRRGEMAALRVRDINLGRGHIRVERSASQVNSKTVIGTTKTHAGRSVAVPASVLRRRHEMLIGKESRPRLVALACTFQWSCRESNPSFY